MTQQTQQRMLATRRIILRVAARAYELEKGKQAAIVDDLIPEYLPAPLSHPVSEKPLDLVSDA